MVIDISRLSTKQKFVSGQRFAPAGSIKGSWKRNLKIRDDISQVFNRSGIDKYCLADRWRWPDGFALKAVEQWMPGLVSSPLLF
jgi:hypothetical protein